MFRRTLAFALALFLLPCTLPAQAQDALGAVKSAVTAKYHVTQATADHSDLVTPGDVITFQKSGMLMFETTANIYHAVSYKQDKFVMGGFSALAMVSGTAERGNRPRKFVSGEKCWLTDVEVKPDGLYLYFLSDPINGARYMGLLKFQVEKKETFPTPDVMLAHVAEVISAAPLPPAQDAAPAAAPAPPPPPPPAALAPIAPPPPPPDQPVAPPPTITLGQKKDDVIAAFGQPTKAVKLGAKEILYFKDLKVTLVNGKVTDVQ